MYMLKGKMKAIHRVRNYSLANYTQRTICFLHITAVILHVLRTPEPFVKHTITLTPRYMLRCAAGRSLGKQSSLPETTAVRVPRQATPAWLHIILFTTFPKEFLNEKPV